MNEAIVSPCPRGAQRVMVRGIIASLLLCIANAFRIWPTVVRSGSVKPEWQSGGVAKPEARTP